MSKHFTNYEEALSYLYNLERFGIKLDLTNITALMSRLGNPHLKFPSVHIAGTNGKGSVAAMMHSIFCEAGYKTALYTSPHLVDFRERIKIGQDMIEKEYIFDFVRKLRDEIDKNGYTFFEVTTALAFQYFADKKVDVAVIETGMGGRLDATNLVNPLVSIITSIGLEHTEHLGNTIPQIAGEKAGIIKTGVHTITGVSQPEALDVIKSVCAERGSELNVVQVKSNYSILEVSISGSKFNFSSEIDKYQGLELNLAGEHQVQNAAICLNAIGKLKQIGWKIDEQVVRNGLKKVYWRGRLEIFRKEPLVILDVAHNPAGIQTLINTLDRFFPEKKIIIIFGVMEDKDHGTMLKEVSKKAKFIVLTKPDYKRAADPEVLEEAMKITNTPYEIIPHINQAYLFALKNAKPDDIICITGSHFTVGEFLSL
ncbi:MAG TPA: folylpolyglutamate synthase/dihydrofolate synthase family protein [candidate division Zixibacteria bacterium]